MTIRTLTELMSIRNRDQKKGVTFIQKQGQLEFLSYADLYQEALLRLSALQYLGCQPGDELVFQVDENREFLVAFWACILGGIVPIPLSLATNEDRKQKFLKVWEVLINPKCITDQTDFFHWLPDDKQGSIRDRSFNLMDLSNNGGEPAIFDAKKDDLAFVQFSSGSTGDPKGVMLTHRNLISNIRTSETNSQHSNEDIMLSWMPLTHDMGLIGFHLNPLYSGMDHYLIPTELFVRRPLLWMDMASNIQATILCSPNFGYSYLLKQLGGDTEKQWDLSHVRLIYNGAEPISYDLSVRFMNVMKQFGLNKEAMYPVYGLAEATLAVSFSDRVRPIEMISLERKEVVVGQPVRVLESSPEALKFVKIGVKSSFCCDVRIVDELMRTLTEGSVGHVQIRGENVTKGYYNNPVATRELIKDDWLTTGDLGFFYKDAFYISGRAKDILFVYGQNFYPHDLEESLISIDQIEPGKVAVAGYQNLQRQEQEILVFVIWRGKEDRFQVLAKEVRQQMNRMFGFYPSQVIPVRSIPKTTSGKLQRYKLANAYKDGAFDEVLHLMNTINIPQVIEGDDFETRLYEIWKSILPPGNWGLEAKFFEVGGNSLKAGQLLIAIKKTFEREVGFEVLLSNPSLKDLAIQLRQLEPSTTEEMTESDFEQEDYPLSAAQRNIFYVWMSDMDSIAYNIPFALRLDGPLKQTELKTAIVEIINEHDTFRSRFFLKGEDPRQIFESAITLDYAVFNILEEELEDRIKAEIKPFQLTSKSLIRFRLFEINRDFHVLLLDAHHIIFDGISLSILLNDLMARLGGSPPDPKTYGYRKYLLQSTHNREQRLSHHRDFWSARLHDLPLIDFPFDFVRPARKQNGGKIFRFQMEAKVSSKIREVAKTNGLSLSTTMLAVYHLFLHKLTNKHKVATGVATTDRYQYGLETDLGMFVKNLPIVSNLAQQSFEQFARDIGTEFRMAVNNQEMAYDEILEGVKRYSSRTSLLDTAFSFQEMDWPTLRTGNLNASEFYFDPGFSKFDLSLEVIPNSGEELECRFEYDTSLFKAASIERYARYLLTLMEAVANHPKALLKDLQLIGFNTEQQLQLGSSGKSCAYPYRNTIQDLISDQVIRTPKRCAVRDEKGQFILTYEELDRRSNQLANLLHTKSLGTGGTVVVHSRRNPTLVVAILAVLKTGNAFLPIDKNLPADRISYLIKDSCADWVLTDRDLSVANSDAKVLILDELDYENMSRKQPQVAEYADHAYMIYTSGSTGKPKGVRVGHGSIQDYVFAAKEQYLSDAKMSFPLFTSISFDLTLTSLFVPLIGGHEIVTYQGEGEEVVQKLLKDNQVDIVKLTPSHLSIISASDAWRANNFQSKIKCFIVGGEAFTCQLASEINGLFDGVKIFNEYGPTEATIGCMIHPYNVDSDDGEHVPIGQPMPNADVYLLDENMRLVPDGIVGELYIGGNFLALGYQGISDVEASRFLPNPFDNNKKCYRTGDMARRLLNGDLVYLGRRDRQLKVNGHRVEPVEVETTLEAYPEITKAIVHIPIKFGHLVAYVQLADLSDSELFLKNVLSKLKEQLPHYMVPRQCVNLNTIPLTPNGKVDFDQLPEITDLVGERPLKKPASELEAIQLNLWKALFNLDRIDTETNFYDIGGDSIKAVQLSARLAYNGIILTAKDILIHQSIQEISGYLNVNGVGNPHQELSFGSLVDSPIHQWFLRQDFEHPSFYNQSVLLQLKSKPDFEVFDMAMTKILAHHHGLNMRLDVEEQVFLVKEDTVTTFSFERKKLVEPMTDSDQEIQRYCQSIKGSLNLIEGPVIKGAIIETFQGDFLFLTAHHTIVDGVSWRILLADLYALCRSTYKGDPYLLRRSASMVEWTQKVAEATAFPVQEIWEGQDSNDAFQLPLDYKVDQWEVSDMCVFKASIPAEIVGPIKKNSYLALGAHMADTLIAAVVCAIKSWTGLSQITLIQEGHGRLLQDIDVSHTIGWFTSLFSTKYQINSTAILEELGPIVENNNLNQHKTFDLSLGRKTQEIRFNYLGEFDDEISNELFELVWLDTGLESHPDNHMTEKLGIDCFMVADDLHFHISYNAKAHDQGTIQTLCDNIQKGLGEVAIKLDKVTISEAVTYDHQLDEQDISTLFAE